MMTRNTENSKCPEYSTLVDYWESLLEDSAQEEVCAHLQICPSCNSRVADLERLPVRVPSDREEVPAEATRRVLEMGRSWIRERREPAMPVVMGHLVQTVNPASLAGIRGALPETEEFLYSAGDYSIRVQISRAPDGQLALRGHAYPEKEKAQTLSRVVLRREQDGEERELSVQAPWGFRAESLDSGSYVLIIHAGDTCLHLPDLRAA